MSFQRIFILVTIILFGMIGVASWMKKGKERSPQSVVVVSEPIEIELPEEEPIVVAETPPENTLSPEVKFDQKEEVVYVSDADLPDADRIDEFFNKRDPKFPVVQTITYKSQVPWQKGRPAWIADYASHFKTSRHFIARSLNGAPNYEKQDVVVGNRFNVFNEDKNFEFYLLVDTLTSNMWFYYYDADTNERVLVKRYKVGLGRPEEASESGTLTPLGKYSLGNKIAVYRPKTMAFHQGEKKEMVRIFGTRWIPFGEEISGCTQPPQGYGIHGLPLQPNEKGALAENLDTLGKFESDGCIRMATKDVEELFAIIITKPTTIEIVKGFHNATPPGEEKKL